jgi:hypothetical protein
MGVRVSTGATGAGGGAALSSGGSLSINFAAAGSSACGAASALFSDAAVSPSAIGWSSDGIGLSLCSRSSMMIQHYDNGWSAKVTQ